MGFVMLSATAGCSTVAQVVDPLNLRGLGQQPVRVGITRLEFPPPLFVPKHSLFNDNLALYLNKPVCFELLNPRQIRVKMGTGRLQFAMLTAGDFEQIAPADTYEILAVPKDTQGRIIRRGLIIVAPNSRLQSLSELKKQRFHFLPPEDPLNEAALGALLEAGVDKKDLNQGLLELGMSLGMHHINSLEVAKSVVLEQNAAGVIDEDDYNKWKETGGSLLLLNPSRDQVRIIAHTVTIPAGPFLAAKNNPPELTAKVKEFLFKVVGKNPLALAPLGYSGFVDPIDLKEYQPFFDVYRRLHPPEVFPETNESDENFEEEPLEAPAVQPAHPDHKQNPA